MVFWPEPSFQIVSTYSELDSLICADHRNYFDHSDIFIQRSEFRKSYLELKKELDNWLRQSSYANNLSDEDPER